MKGGLLTNILMLVALVIGGAVVTGFNHIMIEVLVSLAVIYMFVNSIVGGVGTYVVQNRIKTVDLNFIDRDSFELELSGGRTVLIDCKTGGDTVFGGISYFLLLTASCIWLFSAGWILTAIALIVSNFIMIVLLVWMYFLSRTILDRHFGENDA